MFKKNSKIQFLVNKIKGKIAEEIAKRDYVDNGFVIQKTGIGSDFIVTKQIENIQYREYVDVKSGNAKLTKKQKQTKFQLKRKNINYAIYRVTDEHLQFQIQNNNELQIMCKFLGLDVSNFLGIFVIQVPAHCSNCRNYSMRERVR